MRRRHALDPAALLIYQHRRVGAANAVPERPRERTHLIAVGDVALEENEAPGVFLRQESTFLICQRETRAAANEGLGQFAAPGVGCEKAVPLRLLSDEALPALAFEASAHRRCVRLRQAAHAQAV